MLGTAGTAEISGTAPTRAQAKLKGTKTPFSEAYSCSEVLHERVMRPGVQLSAGADG